MTEDDLKELNNAVDELDKIMFIIDEMTVDEHPGDLYFEDLDSEDEDEDYLEDYNENEDDEDEAELGDSDFCEHSTSESPWVFNVPSAVEQQLAAEKASVEPSTYAWKTHWPNVDIVNIDPAQSAADYYLLFGLVNNSFADFEPLVLPSLEDLQRAGEILKKTETEIQERLKINQQMLEDDPRSALTKLADKADILLHELVEKLDPAFKDYVHMACGGELRHHKAFSNTLRGYRKGAWVRWYYIFEQHGVEAITKMAELFREFTPGSAYGGERWANAADILYQREVGELGPTEFVNKQLFVDRVFTLEHNGGCFLNKLEWANHRSDRPGYNGSFHGMKDNVLNAHASNPVDIDTLYGHASGDVQILVQEYLTLALGNDISISGYWKGQKFEGSKVERDKIIPLVESLPLSEAAKKEPTSVIDWSDEIEKEKTKPAKKFGTSDVISVSPLEKKYKPVVDGDIPIQPMNLTWEEVLAKTTAAKHSYDNASYIQDNILGEGIVKTKEWKVDE